MFGLGRLLGNGKAEFHRRMQQAITELGLQVLAGDEDGCMVSIPFNGDVYRAAAISFDGRSVDIQVQSRVPFTPGDLPEDLFPILDSLNREMRTCRYAPHHGARDSRFVAVSTMLVSRLTARSLYEAIQEQLAHVVGLDSLLESRDYIACNGD